jgi:phage tail tape-measure protein
MTKTALTTFAALGLAGLLAACGTNATDRTEGGAAAGAATGAGIGALGGPVGLAVGGVVGGGAGAIAGATTSAKDVNLGKPVWNNPDTRVPTPNGPVAPAAASN